jgi:acyl dehydratase
MQACVGELHHMPAWNREVTSDGIWHFALGIGDDNPLWWDEQYAKESSWGGLIAPPCYLYSHSSGPRLKPGDGRMSVEVFLPGVLGLWAGERWRWIRPVRPGERIRAVGGLIVAEPRQGGFGGRSLRQVERINLLTDKDELVAEIDHTIMRFERGQTRERSSYLDRERAVWHEEDRQRFREQYDLEPANRRGGAPRYIEDVRPGDPIDQLLKGPLTVTNIVGFLLGFGCPLAPTNRIHHQQLLQHPGAKMIHPVTGVEDNIEAPHWDRDLARASGMPDGYDFGAQRFSWLSHLISDWAGDAGFLCELDARLLRPNVLGDVTWLGGRVDAVDLTSGEAKLLVTATNQLGELTARATATVRLPRKAA